jgi:adenylate cyclase
VAELSAAEPDEQRIEYRIGVNLGDVIVDGDDIYGDGVNVAARLQEIAERGGVCISEKVQTEVRGKLNVEFVGGGTQTVKNVRDPLRIWRWSPGQVEASDAALTLSPLSRECPGSSSSPGTPPSPTRTAPST